MWILWKFSDVNLKQNTAQQQIAKVTHHYSSFEDQKVERHSSGQNICSPNTVYTNGNSTVTPHKGPITARTEFCTLLSCPKHFPGNAGTYKKIYAFQRQLGIK